MSLELPSSARKGQVLILYLSAGVTAPSPFSYIASRYCLTSESAPLDLLDARAHPLRSRRDRALCRS